LTIDSCLANSIQWGLLEGSGTRGGRPLRGTILQCENRNQVVDLTERLVQGRSLHEEIVDILREMVLERRLSLWGARC
jgi:hypothetical protein